MRLRGGGRMSDWTVHRASFAYTAYASAIFAEYVGATQGLGHYMSVASQYFNADLVFGAVIVTASHGCDIKKASSTG